MRQVSITQIIALFLRSWKKVIVAILILSVLLGVYKGVKEYKAFRDPMNDKTIIQEEYQNELEIYAENVEGLTREIEGKKQTISLAETYLDESVLMNIDPYNAYKCVIDLSVCITDDEAYSTTVEYYTTPESYMITRIQNMYSALWQAVNCCTLPGFDCVDFEEKYVRELVTVSSINGNVIEIKAVFNDEEIANRLARAAYQFVVSNLETVAAASYDHELIEFASSTKECMEESVFTQKEAKEKVIQSALSEVSSLEEKLEKLQKPEMRERITVADILLGTVKFGFVGGVLGFFLSVVLAGIYCIVSGKMLFTTDLTKWGELQHIGTISGKSSKLLRRVQTVIGEREWGKSADAVNYITEMISKTTSGSNVINLVSTLPQAAIEMEVTSIKEPLEEKGFSVAVVYEAERSAELFDLLNTNARTVLVEKEDVSYLHSIQELLSVNSTMNGQIKDFIYLR